MTALKIEATEISPYILLDKGNETFEISGNALPNDPTAFYTPIAVWLEAYVKVPNDNTIFNFKLNYFNSASAKYLLELLGILARAKEGGKSVKILWNYYDDDDDMKNAGEEFAYLSQLDFEFISYQ